MNTETTDIRLVVCTKLTDFNSMVSVALEKKGVVVSNSSHISKWARKTVMYDFNDSKFRLAIVLITKKIFSLKLADAVKYYNPIYVGMIGVCTGKFLGTTFVGFSSDAARGDVKPYEECRTKMIKDGYREPLGLYNSSTIDGYVQVPFRQKSYSLPCGINPTTLDIFKYGYALNNAVREFPQLNIINAPFLSYPGIRDDCDTLLKRHCPSHIIQSDSVNVPLALDKHTYDFFATLTHLDCHAFPVIKCVSHVGKVFLENKKNVKEFKRHYEQELTYESQTLYDVHASQKAAKCMIELLFIVVKLPLGNFSRSLKINS